MLEKTLGSHSSCHCSIDTDRFGRKKRDSLYIKNREEFASHGYKKGREAAINILEHMLYALDPYIATKRLIGLHGEILTVGHLHFDLSQRGNIYVLGAGKATFTIVTVNESLKNGRYL